MHPLTTQIASCYDALSFSFIWYEVCLEIATCACSTKYHIFLSEGCALLPDNVTHYVIPDPQVAREYLEIFENPHIQGIIFTQTAVHSVSSPEVLKLNVYWMWMLRMIYLCCN
jgi:hypothetical protein